MSDQTLHLTDQQVRDGLNKAVEERGADFRYQTEYGTEASCVNFIDGKPACVAGNVYAQYGIQAPEAMPFDVWTGSTVSYLTDSRYGYVKGQTYRPLSFESDRGQQALAIAQRWQDAGYTWGEARDQALKYLDGDDSVEKYPVFIADVPEDEK